MIVGNTFRLAQFRGSPSFFRNVKVTITIVVKERESARGLASLRPTMPLAALREVHREMAVCLRSANPCADSRVAPMGAWLEPLAQSGHICQKSRYPETRDRPDKTQTARRVGLRRFSGLLKASEEVKRLFWAGALMNDGTQCSHHGNGVGVLPHIPSQVDADGTLIHAVIDKLKNL